jgi:hypothetical protein
MLDLLRFRITRLASLAQLGFVLPALGLMLPPLLAAPAPSGRPNFSSPLLLRPQVHSHEITPPRFLPSCFG